MEAIAIVLGLIVWQAFGPLGIVVFAVAYILIMEAITLYESWRRDW